MVDVLRRLTTVDNNVRVADLEVSSFRAFVPDHRSAEHARIKFPGPRDIRHVPVDVIDARILQRGLSAPARARGPSTASRSAHPAQRFPPPEPVPSHPFHVPSI